MTKEKIQTRKDEVRYVTSDPKRMLNKYLTKRVLRAYKETFMDKDTGNPVEIEHNEVLFEQGKLIDQDTLAKIRFYIQEGSITEVEVSNQKRLGFEVEHTCFDLYRAKVNVDAKKQTFLLYAQSVSNALDILGDYMELHARGGFFIEEVKLHDGVKAVIVDNLVTRKQSNPELDRQYILGQISVEEYLNARVPDDEEEHKEDQTKRLFYHISARVLYGKATSADDKNAVAEQEMIEDYIVHSYTATRANMLIEKYLTDKQKAYAETWNKNHPESPYLMRTITSFIEESKIFPAGCFIPQEFSVAHKEEIQS